jgi:cell division protease FtsH
MSERLGLAMFEEVCAPFFNPLRPMLSQERRPYSERTAEAIDAEVSTLLNEAHARVRDNLNARREFLDLPAKMLLEREAVDRTALDALLKEHGGKPVSPAEGNPVGSESWEL